MKIKLKKLKEQVMVITGASSGIGLVTSRMAARYGTKLVLASRNEEALQKLVQELQDLGTEAAYVTADVSKEEDVSRIAEETIQRFGGFDTWVNNAGVSIYGKLLEVSVEDQRRLFETNFWGVVYGSRIAAEHMRQRGGSLINIGSILADRAIPLQGIYSASKHAVKAYTDALRMELEQERAPISVTLIKPAAIDTPYTKHAKNYLPVEPQNAPPIYAPELVAEAILRCAERPERDVIVGGAGKAISLTGMYAPRMSDKVMESMMFDLQKTGHPKRDIDDSSLYQSSRGLEERGGYEGYVAESSLYAKASLHPAMTGILMLTAGMALAILLGNERPKQASPRNFYERV